MLEAETGVALCFDFGLFLDFDFTQKPVNVVWHIEGTLGWCSLNDPKVVTKISSSGHQVVPSYLFVNRVVLKLC